MSKTPAALLFAACPQLHPAILARGTAESAETAPHAAATTPRFRGLGDLPGGLVISFAYGLSDAGDAFAGESFSEILQVHGDGIQWQRVAEDGWQAMAMSLPASDALNSPAAGVAGNGRWVVGRVSYGAPTAPALDTDTYHWNEDAGFARLGVPGTSCWPRRRMSTRVET